LLLIHGSSSCKNAPQMLRLYISFMPAFHLIWPSWPKLHSLLVWVTVWPWRRSAMCCKIKRSLIHHIENRYTYYRQPQYILSIPPTAATYFGRIYRLQVLNTWHLKLKIKYIYSYIEFVTSQKFYESYSILCSNWKVSNHWREVPTWRTNLFIILNNSTCFGHLYAHLQEHISCVLLHMVFSTVKENCAFSFTVLNTIGSNTQLMYSWRWAYRCLKHVELFKIINKFVRQVGTSRHFHIWCTDTHTSNK
jgi:hypothetical protein